jgi:hypothetical protein
VLLVRRCRAGRVVVLVELNVVEQRYQAVLEVLNDGISVAGRPLTGQFPAVSFPCSDDVVERETAPGADGKWIRGQNRERKANRPSPSR